MAIYIKANPLVAEFVGAREKKRRQYPDGNWCLWPTDLSDFGLPCQADAICARVGAAKLSMIESKLEFEGRQCAPLPEAQDERFRMPAAPAAAAEPEPAAEPEATTEPPTTEPEPEEEAEA